MLAGAIHLHRDGAPVGVAQRRLERFGQALLDCVGTALDLQPVDHDLDGVLAVAVELGQLVDLVHGAVDAKPHEALRAQLVDELRLLALSSDDERGDDHHPGALRESRHMVHHLRHALRGEHHVVVGAVRVAHAREQQPHVVVDLGHRPHGRSRIVRGGLLLDGDRRRQALDQVHVGLLHELQELARVRRERFDVAALPLRIEGVEGKRRFSGARKPRHDDELVARNVEADVPEIVGASTPDSNRFHRAIC